MLFLVLSALNATVWLFMPTITIPVICSTICLIFYSFVFNFFRCPKRSYRGPRKDRVLSSVDGKVVVIEKVFEPEFIKDYAVQVSVFMSPLNVHANWFPVEGEVVYVKHHPGRFLSAYLPKSSTENERSTIGILLPDGKKVTVRQVAGAMARRIVTYAFPGQAADFDEHLGFIKFGSRVDIYLPIDSEILVTLNQTTRGGITPLAILPKS